MPDPDAIEEMYAYLELEREWEKERSGKPASAKEGLEEFFAHLDGAQDT